MGNCLKSEKENRTEEDIEKFNDYVFGDMFKGTTTGAAPPYDPTKEKEPLMTWIW